MLKKYIYKLEELLVWAQTKLTNKQFIFLGSVLVGISSGLAVIILKTFAHWVFNTATYITKFDTFFKYGIIHVKLHIIGILFTVFVI